MLAFACVACRFAPAPRRFVPAPRRFAPVSRRFAPARACRPLAPPPPSLAPAQTAHHCFVPTPPNLVPARPRFVPPALFPRLSIALLRLTALVSPSHHSYTIHSPRPAHTRLPPSSTLTASRRWPLARPHHPRSLSHSPCATVRARGLSFWARPPSFLARPPSLRHAASCALMPPRTPVPHTLATARHSPLYPLSRLQPSLMPPQLSLSHARAAISCCSAAASSPHGPLAPSLRLLAPSYAFSALARPCARSCSRAAACARRISSHPLATRLPNWTRPVLE
ncbi:hypothetical protein DENSPDRAFT_582504 [Dentipellis sp. KUC8613]|nr:hypothetical protein DENSPDRAFT_582504 [Dentipellis sp. KUC8613]